MKRVFISCPIKGKQYEEVLEMRRVAQEKLQQRFLDEEISIIDSFIPAMYFDKNNNPIIGLGTCITLMGNADLVYMCKGWEESRGCSIERRVAIDYDIPIIYEDNSSPITN
jgi:hypothetical protein